jgi:mannosyltransferase OCH1-like enzyme
MIPRIIHRTLPAEPRLDVDGIWQTVVSNSEGWDFRTYQSPRNAADWPITGHAFGKCVDRAMESNLVRFEALWVHGGVYLDSDVSLVRSLEPLLDSNMFVAFEDMEWIGTAVVGAVPRHPAVRDALDAMVAHVVSGRARSTCPRIVTPLWKGREDINVLAPESFYPVPFRSRNAPQDWSGKPNVFGVHHWHGSWM